MRKKNYKMTLKDWKRQLVNKDDREDGVLKVWNNNINGTFLIVGEAMSERGEVYDVEYSTDDFENRHIIKSFKSKPQAFKYAKAYMRKH